MVLKLILKFQTSKAGCLLYVNCMITAGTKILLSSLYLLIYLSRYLDQETTKRQKVIQFCFRKIPLQKQKLLVISVLLFRCKSCRDV